MKLLTSIFFITTYIIFNINFGYSQTKREPNTNSMQWLDAKKLEFQASKNDSLFISKNSDSKYRYIYLTRGDEPEDVEDEIFNAKKGQVVGPFRAESHNYLFKVVGLDSLRYRFRLSHIFIKPKGGDIKDTAEALVTGQKIVKLLNKGGDFQEALTESGSDYKKFASELGFHSQSVAQSADGDVGWIWEGTVLPAINKALMKTNKGQATMVQSKYGVHILKIVDKQQGFYKATIVSLVKNMK